MTQQAATHPSLQQMLAPIITREIAGIAAIHSAITHQTPDYVVFFHAAKQAKQANIEQLTTLIRIGGGLVDERGGLRKALTSTQAALSSRVSTTVTLRAMRLAEVELVKLYSDALVQSDGLAKRALTKVLGRAMVNGHLLSAHLAKRSGSAADADVLPVPLAEYFAGADARACMRCHLDRPGLSGALERSDPHPYTYVCAACHDEIPAEFPPDLASQMDRWPRDVREAQILQHAIGRTSRLNAIGCTLRPLAGLVPELPTPAAERAVIVPAMTPAPGPARGERRGRLEIRNVEGLEGDYIRELFSSEQMWRNW
jgi:hypothetical protein